MISACLNAHSRSSAIVESRRCARTKSRSLERVEARVDVGVAAVQLGDRARPERHPDDRRVLGDALVAGGQPVEARADHRLQARRHGELVEVAAAVERRRSRRACAPSPRGRAGCRPRCGAAARRGGRRAARARRAARRAAPRSPPRRARAELDRDRALARPCRAPGGASRAPGARSRASRIGAAGLAQEVEQLEAASARPSAGPRRRARAAAARRAARARGGCPSAARPARSPSPSTCRAASSGRRSGSRAPTAIVRSWSRSSVPSRSSSVPSLAETVSTSSLLRMPGGALEDLDDRPVRDALAVREAAAPEHVGALRRTVRDLGQRAGSCRCRGRRRSSRARARRRPAPSPRARPAARARRSRPTSGASRRRPRAVASSCTPSASQTRTGSALPLATIGSCSAYSIACAVAR